MFKIIVSILIPDVTKRVVDAGFKRQIVVEKVKKELTQMKNKSGLESFEDMNDRLQR